MKLFCTYKYYFSKSKIADEINAFEAVGKYLEQNMLSYENFLYRFSLYYNKRKNTVFFEQHTDLGEIMDKKEKYANLCFISNVDCSSWKQNRYKTFTMQQMQRTFDDVKKTNVSVSLAFNNVNWFGKAGDQPLVSDDENEYSLRQVLTPLNNNITIHDNTYDKKTEIYLTFEFTQDMDVTEFLRSAEEVFGIAYCERFLWQVFTKKELTANQAKKLHVEKLIKNFVRSCQIKSLNKQDECLKKISIARVLKEKNIQYSYKNGVYTINKVDAYNNLIEIGFDYVDKLLISYVNYIGAEFTYHFNFNEIKIITQHDIENYLEQVLAFVTLGESDLFFKIRELYLQTPEGLFQ